MTHFITEKDINWDIIAKEVFNSSNIWAELFYGYEFSNKDRYSELLDSDKDIIKGMIKASFLTTQKYVEDNHFKSILDEHRK